MNKLKSSTTGFFHAFALACSLAAQLGIGMAKHEVEQEQTGAKGSRESLLQKSAMPKHPLNLPLSAYPSLVCWFETGKQSDTIPK